MANKFYGVIGFGESEETPPESGVWVDKIVELNYYGDIVRTSRRLQSREYLNDTIVVNNSISIVADAYLNQHFFAIRYLRWAGALWTVTNVEVQAPRLILTLGGVYNGPTAN